jgi:hypothetical protein
LAESNLSEVFRRGKTERNLAGGGKVMQPYAHSLSLMPLRTLALTLILAVAGIGSGCLHRHHLPPGSRQLCPDPANPANYPPRPGCH